MVVGSPVYSGPSTSAIVVHHGGKLRRLIRVEIGGEHIADALALRRRDRVPLLATDADLGSAHGTRGKTRCPHPNLLCVIYVDAHAPGGVSRPDDELQHR